MGKQLITRRLSATATVLFGPQGRREVICGVILAAFCCPGCPEGHLWWQFGEK